MSSVRYTVISQWLARLRSIMRLLAFRLLFFLVSVVLTACGGGGGDDEPPVSAPITPAAFEHVDNAARAAYATHGVAVGLAVYDEEGTKVFEQMYGDFSPDRRVAIASASKLVSGVTLFRLIDAGYLSSTRPPANSSAGPAPKVRSRYAICFPSPPD
jgi:D-alanyl-D-alanine-carboxypeptidase/D-alanyl-D-alanine-endopeptidase